jgi:uncharacterized protein
MRFTAVLAAILSFAVVAPLALGPAPALAQQPGPPIVSVTGTGEVERVPDFARIFISVVNQADTVGEAVEANNEATSRALSRLAELGVDRDDIQTSNFQVFDTPERRDRDGNIRPSPAYTASHQLRVITRDIDSVGQLAGEVLALEGMTFQSIAWGLDRSEDAQDEARRLAVADARRQAEVLTQAAGVAMGSIRQISEGHVSIGPRPEMDQMVMRSAVAQAVPIVPPAFIRYGASVRVEWELTQ